MPPAAPAASAPPADCLQLPSSLTRSPCQVTPQVCACCRNCHALLSPFGALKVMPSAVACSSITRACTNPACACQPYAIKAAPRLLCTAGADPWQRGRGLRRPLTMRSWTSLHQPRVRSAMPQWQAVGPWRSCRRGQPPHHSSRPRASLWRACRRHLLPGASVLLHPCRWVHMLPFKDMCALTDAWQTQSHHAGLLSAAVRKYNPGLDRASRDGQLLCCCKFGLMQLCMEALHESAHLCSCVLRQRGCGVLLQVTLSKRLSAACPAPPLHKPGSPAASEPADTPSPSGQSVLGLHFKSHDCAVPLDPAPMCLQSDAQQQLCAFKCPLQGQNHSSWTWAFQSSLWMLQPFSCAGAPDGGQE